MTPSEVVDWFDQFNGAYCPGLDPETAQVYEHAAATIRAQAEALKIATEALEMVGFSGKFQCFDDKAWDQVNEALARIKEVGA